VACVPEWYNLIISRCWRSKCTTGEHDIQNKRWSNRRRIRLEQTTGYQETEVAGAAVAFPVGRP